MSVIFYVLLQQTKVILLYVFCKCAIYLKLNTQIIQLFSVSLEVKLYKNLSLNKLLWYAKDDYLFFACQLYRSKDNKFIKTILSPIYQILVLLLKI